MHVPPLENKPVKFKGRLSSTSKNSHEAEDKIKINKMSKMLLCAHICSLIRSVLDCFKLDIACLSNPPADDSRHRNKCMPPVARHAHVAMWRSGARIHQMAPPAQHASAIY